MTTQPVQLTTATAAPKPTLRYLQGYPSDTLAQVERLLQQDRVAGWLRAKYSQAHDIRTDKALFEHVQALKTAHLRGAETLAKVLFDNKLQVVQHALGTHTTIARVQGAKLKAKREIRVAALFKHTPLEFLNMICAHELAHLKQREHDKAFYQLCRHIEPDYHQLEFELRVYLVYLETGGPPLW